MDTFTNLSQRFNAAPRKRKEKSAEKPAERLD
jgi:hypothetical protein